MLLKIFITFWFPAGAKYPFFWDTAHGLNLLCNNKDAIVGISKSEFKNFLSLATQESYFTFNDVSYKQKNGVAMRPTMTSWTYYDKCFLVILWSPMAWTVPKGI